MKETGLPNTCFSKHHKFALIDLLLSIFKGFVIITHCLRSSSQNLNRDNFNKEVDILIDMMIRSIPNTYIPSSELISSAFSLFYNV